MRLKMGRCGRRVKADLPIEFVQQQLTSDGGLELVARYVRRLALRRRIERALAPCALGSDYGAGRVGLLGLALLIIGGRRLEHLQYLADDPLVARLCGLARIPTARTVANWLTQFTRRSVAALAGLDRDLLDDQIARHGLRRLTLDVDRTVVRTGGQVAWASRGFNPHQRKDPSYYPLLAHLAQTGQILALRNHPGNVHDSRGAARFVRTLIGDLRRRFGRRAALEFRIDAAFFQRAILTGLSRAGCTYAIKVGFWKWVGVKPLVAAQRTWMPIAPGLSAFETTLPLAPWALMLRVAVYRKHVQHETRKNFQLDLFSPDDGHYEYSAVTTNTTRGLAALWAFMAGRGAQEKTLAELKGECAFDVVPTRHYRANSAWQQLSILAHNLKRSFRLDTGAAARPRSRKRTYAYALRSLRTLRFVLIARAGRLTRIQDRHVLRLTTNPATQQLYNRVTRALAA